MRALVLGAALSIVAANAWAQSQVAMTYDMESGQVAMIVIPSDDKELDDPAFNPPDGVQVRMTTMTYEQSNPDTLIPAVEAAAQTAMALGSTQTQLPPDEVLSVTDAPALPLSEPKIQIDTVSGAAQ